MAVAARVKPKDFFTDEEWAPLAARSTWFGLWLVAHAWLTIAAAALDHLGVAGNDGHARRPRRGRHRLQHPPKIIHRQTFLDDERGAQAQRPGAGHGQIVERAAHRQFADIAAGEE